MALGGTGSDGAKVADRTAHLKEWPTGGNAAVAPASNLLLELRSLDDMPNPPACSREQLSKLAKQILSRIPEPS